MTSSSKTTQQSQQSTTRPWAEAMPLVGNLISQYGNLNPGVTANQGGALTNLNNSLSNLPNFGESATGAVQNLFNSSSAPSVGVLNTAYDTLRTNLTPTASGANLDPYSTPGFGDALKTSMNDITDRVKGVYAGSGRDPSGAGSFAGTLGRGLTEGTAPVIASQYNTNFRNMIDANNTLFGAGQGTSTALNNLRQSDLQNGIAGITAAGSIPGIYSSPALAQYGAANLQYGQPFQNLAQLLQPSIALAGLGQQSSGTGTSTATSTPSLMSSIGQGVGALGGAFQMAPSISALLPSLAMFSDERLKTDIAPVGKLNDGQNVYSYRYKGDPVPRIGLMAGEVERKHPEAVVRHPSGYKMVDYGLATRGARVGALREAA